MNDIPTLRRILKENRVIAVVGLSARQHRPSYSVARYLLDHGYRVIPVNPSYQEVLGQKCYPSLRDVPERVGIVDCFRKSEEIVPIAEDATREEHLLPLMVAAGAAGEDRATIAFNDTFTGLRLSAYHFG